MGNCFERKNEKLKANNKRVVTYFKWSGRGNEPVEFKHSFHTSV
jgi:hypothetical protein